MKKFLCWLIGHRYKKLREITENFQEMKCSRCKAEFVIHNGLKAVVPLTNGMRQAHNKYLAGIEKAGFFGETSTTESTLTITDIMMAIEHLKKSKPQKKIVMQAGDYPDLTDAQFVMMIGFTGVEFVGSIKDGEKMIERCKKLGLNISDPVEVKYPFDTP